MSRPLRLLVKDGWYHVTARGNERRAIFRGDGDCTHFLKMLGELPERYGVRVAAYVLMGNHYHLILSDRGRTTGLFRAARGCAGKRAEKGGLEALFEGVLSR